MTDTEIVDWLARTAARIGTNEKNNKCVLTYWHDGRKRKSSACGGTWEHSLRLAVEKANAKKI